MPWGVLVDCTAVFLGGLAGWKAGSRLPERTRGYLTVIFGFCAMSIGINSLVKVAAMTPVILAVILGSLLGDLVHLEEKIQSLAASALKKLPSDGKTNMDHLVTVIVLFCFSGFGIYGVFVAGMSGDHSILFSKAVLDFFTAAIFAITIGMAVMFVTLPMLLIMGALFGAAMLIGPLMSPVMLKDFMACGGVLTIAAGLRVSNIKHTPIANMIPALVLVIPFSWLWSLLPM